MATPTEEIQAELARIEHENNVRVLYAVESGSRAWGFASHDSDFDVRFIYVHPLEWYLSIRKHRDVIECPINHQLDISGWDLRKALLLFKKSNPPLLEWLGSPIVYCDRFGLADTMQKLMQQTFSPLSCMYHYLHMAQRNYREYLRGETVRIKKYFYVLRPILACAWIKKYRAMPPTEFSMLYADAALPPFLRASIDELLRRKMAGDELDIEPRIAVINDYLDSSIDFFASVASGMEHAEADIKALDRLFLETMGMVWRG